MYTGHGFLLSVYYVHCVLEPFMTVFTNLQAHVRTCVGVFSRCIYYIIMHSSASVQLTVCSRRNMQVMNTVNSL